MAALLWLATGTPATGGEVIDMAGRHVTVPDQIHRIYAAHDPPAIFLASLAPDLMVGVPFDRPPGSARFLPPAVNRLPRIRGAGRIDPERLLALGIDLVVIWNMRGPPDAFAAQMDAIGIPAVMVDAAPFSRYAATFRFLGALLHRQARSEVLARALEQASARLAGVQAIPGAGRVRVYYADSADGLRSQCATAFRGEVVPLAGGANVLPCRTADSMGASVTVSLERLLLLDPDVIVARSPAIARFLRADAGWQALRAVREGRVYAFPDRPFNWVERPHSQFKLLTVQWLAQRLYPGRLAFDFAQATRNFYRTFFGMELSDDDLARLRG
ncbi:ABC transporter substrate-binding protein [Rhodopila globiformis]|uniref:ABC transporter substrate-binding protein n=1 Tax=Rhodopila globiformis TaxID=1071 RepID=UPI001304DCF0|nr:ABC transporter substrate-binding protein [Rhodopila globiformis]